MGCCKKESYKDVVLHESNLTTRELDVGEREAAGADAEGGNLSDNPAKVSRAQWTSPTEFLLTCVGYSVGLGNVWRFPYLCYKNGGGAFLIPYVIMMIFIGMPLLFMEYCIGQYFGIGSLSVFKRVCPLFQGVGIGYSILNGLVCIYYNVIIAIAIFYLFGSLNSSLPWSSCDNSWNTENCGDPIFNANSSCAGNCSSSFGNLSFSESNVLSSSSVMIPSLSNMSDSWNKSSMIAQRTSPTDEYFRLALLSEGPDNSIANLGSVRWHLCLCLLLSWLLVVLFVSRGIKSSGKVAYFTATFPYVMLTVLVVRGATLNGAKEGILYFIIPKWEKLVSPDVWFQAATQLFYSTNLAWGGMITMASYNMFNHNCYRDAVVINLVSFCTSLYAGVAVFSIIGYMAHEYRVPIDEVIKSGPGLAFVAYPRALSLMPLAPMWSALFFFMLFLLGIGSQMVLIETVVTGFVDEFPRLGLNPCIRLMTTVSVCVICFLLGITMTTQGGMYMLQLMDHYTAGFCVLIIAVVECLVINWIYGNEKMCDHVREMIGKRMNVFWQVCWMVISPIIIVAILVFSFVRYKAVEYNDQPYPLWADILGWGMTLASNVPIVIVALYVFIRAPGTSLLEKWRSATKASAVSRQSQSIDQMAPLQNWKQEVSIEVNAIEQPVESLDESLAYQRNRLFIKDTKEVTTSSI